VTAAEVAAKVVTVPLVAVRFVAVNDPLESVVIPALAALSVVRLAEP
jgi:hypothetical protein